MEENKELETVTESQRNAGKGLFLSGIIVGFAATLLVVGGIFIAFQIHRIVTVKRRYPMTRILLSMPRRSKSCNCWKTR